MNSAPPHCHVLMTTDAVGGVWIFSTTLARELCRRNYRVTLVTLGPPPRDDQVHDLLGSANLDLRVTDLALEWNDPEGLDCARARKILADIERCAAPDLVHLNSFREASLAWRGPVLVVAHSCVRSWWRACHDEEPNAPQWDRYAANVASGLLAADAWVAPTAAFRSSVNALYAPPSQGQTIWNGVECISAPSVKEPIILAAGRFWDEAKGLHLLTSVAPDVSWSIRVAGPLTSHGATGSSAENVEWLGALSHAAVIAQLSRAAVFVSPALYEPFGLTVLEAAAAGCALVLSDIPSLRELWDDAAVFVEAGDADSLRAALNAVCADASLRHHLQRAAARRARRYSLQATADAYAAAYAALGDERFAGSPSAASLPVGARA